MSDKTNVLWVGDDTDAPWHPMEPAKQHHAPSFKPEAYRHLVLNSARWLSASS